MDQTDLKALLPEELAQLLTQMNQPAYRARQLFSWIHNRGVNDFAEMSDLPKGLRQELRRKTQISRLKQVGRRVSGGEKAVKFLFETPTGHRIEAVLILDDRRRTACLSSQVGCALDCKFCATGKMGFIRHLDAAQIVDQLIQINQYLGKTDRKVGNVVMMGMGEPLHNYDHLTQALRLMRSPWGAALGGRRITVSTAGHVPGILRLAEEDDLNVGLAISLNATTDGQRQRLMPINRKYPIAELLEGAAAFYRRRGRRPTIEYVLMAGETDTDEDARRLGALTAELPCMVNLIPYNELGADSQFHRPAYPRVLRFQRLLQEANPALTVTMRESRGRDIDAACGQLFQQGLDGRAKPAPAAP